MAIVLQADDTNEYMHDTDYELLGNHGIYGVITGCAVSYDATNLTVDIAAGTILHNGVAVAVAAQTDAVTIVPDGSNELWAYIGIDSSGVGQIVHGDAAADSSTEPTKPENGDYVIIAMVKVDAALTIANSASTKLDKRLMVTGPWTVMLGSDYTHTQSNTTLANVTGLAFPLAASLNYAFEFCIVQNSGTTPDFKCAVTVPSGATIAYSVLRTAGAALTYSDINTSGGAVTVDGTGANSTLWIKGMVQNSTTAGNLQFQAAQQTSNASDTKVITGSWLRVALDNAS